MSSVNALGIAESFSINTMNVRNAVELVGVPSCHERSKEKDVAPDRHQKQATKRNVLLVSIFLCCAILFSLFTVFYQVTQLGLGYLETTQVNRHLRVLQGHAGNAYQYRILSEYLVEGLILALTNLGFPQPITSAFILFRIFQNTLIFLLAAFYYQKLGLNTYVILIGLSLLAWGMTHGLYDSDLQFNTYSDVIFYLAAGLIILLGQCAWLIPITGLAALNRETSGLIPLMLIAYTLWTNSRNKPRKIALMIAAVSCGLYGIIFFSLRHAYGEQPLIVHNGVQLGREFFVYNISQYETWVQLFGTMGILPLMAIFSFRQWPDGLRAFFWAIVPIWFLVHPFVSIMAETRLFLVPFALIFVPGALFGIEGVRSIRQS